MALIDDQVVGPTTAVQSDDTSIRGALHAMRLAAQAEEAARALVSGDGGEGVGDEGGSDTEKANAGEVNDDKAGASLVHDVAEIEALQGTWLDDPTRSDSLDPFLKSLGVPKLARFMAGKIINTYTISIEQIGSGNSGTGGGWGIAIRVQNVAGVDLDAYLIDGIQRTYASSVFLFFDSLFHFNVD
jgi:hypothetical protein